MKKYLAIKRSMDIKLQIEEILLTTESLDFKGNILYVIASHKESGIEVKKELCMDFENTNLLKKTTYATNEIIKEKFLINCEKYIKLIEELNHSTLKYGEFS